jgi:choline-glycine betaine transporter
MIYLASKFGQLEDGGQNAKPEFKTLSWFAMFSVREWGLIVVLEYFRTYLSFS